MEKILEKMADKPLIFKGGSSLLFGYGLDRFSEDLDFDVNYPLNIKYVINSLKDIATDFNIKKDTETTKRLIVNIDNDFIKIEISLRKIRNIDDSKLKSFINNIKLYSIDELLKLKINAFKSRVVARDLYDIAYILNQYFKEIEKSSPYLLDICYETFAKDVMDMVIDYEQVFSNDNILDIEDLFKTAQRLERFKKEYIKHNNKPSIEHNPSITTSSIKIKR